MPTLLEIRDDPNYVNANAETKAAIFAKWSALDNNYAGANDETKAAIRQKFGIEQPQAQPAPQEQPQQEPSFADRLKSLAMRRIVPSADTASLAKGLGKGFVSEAGNIATNLAGFTRRLNPWSTGDGIAASRAGLQQFRKENENLPGFTTGGIAADIAGTAGIPMTPAAGLTGRAVSGLGAGGIAGYMTGGEEGVTTGAGVGGAVNAVLPPLVSGAVRGGVGVINIVKKLTEPMREGGEKLIADRYLNSILSDADKSVIASELRRSKEIIHGSKPTAAEAVSAIPEGTPLQAHQAIVSQEPKGISGAFGKRIQEQMAARDKALAFAGTEDDIERMIVDRSAKVAPLYKKVEESTARASVMPVVARVSTILKNNQNRTAIASPLSKIRDALVIKTETGDVLESNPQALKSLSDDIRDMMGRKTIGGSHEYDVKVLDEIKTMLDDQIGKAEPAFKEAQKMFADLSKPINKMQIGQALKAKMVEPTGDETPGSYIRAINNERKLLKDSIGFGRKGIEHYLSPEELSAVNRVAADLERTLAASRPLQKTNLRGGVNVANETSISLPNLLSRPAMITNYVMKSLGKNIEPKVDAYFKHLYLNPQELSKVIGRLPQYDRSMVAEKIAEFGKSVAPRIATAAAATGARQ